MVQFDAVKLRSGEFVVVLQSDLVDYLPTRLVAPLVPIDEAPSKVDRLNPIVTIDGRQYLIAVHLAATVPARQIGPTEMMLRDYDFMIKAALDILISGF